MSNLDERIRLARQRAGLSKSGLARLLGVTPTSCISWELPESDRNSARPNVDNLTRLAVVFDVRFEWLAGGKGAMTYDGSSDASPVRQRELPPDQSLLLDLFRRLSPAKQDAVIELLKDLRTK